MRIFWTVVNWLGFYALVLWLNYAVSTFFGDLAASILFLVAIIAAIAAAIRFIVLFVKKQTPAEKNPEPASESAEEPGLQN